MTTSSIFILPTAGTFILELLIFLFILFILTKYLLPPLNKAMQARQDQIRTQLESADRARAEAQEFDQDRRAELEAARHQAREIVEQANRTAAQSVASGEERGQAEFDRRVLDADREVQLARQRALEEASNRLGEVVMDAVERVLGREVDPAAHRDLIDEAVVALGASDAGSAGNAPAGAGQHS
jgi:F-type H+-transporting ATPase subunit b